MSSLITDIQNRLVAQLGDAESIDEAFDRLNTEYTALTNMAGIITQISDPYLDLLGYTQEQVVGQHFKILIHPDYKEEIAEMQQRYIAGDLSMPGSWLLQKADGTSIRVFVDAVRITDKNEDTHKLSIITPIRPENP